MSYIKGFCGKNSKKLLKENIEKNTALDEETIKSINFSNFVGHSRNITGFDDSCQHYFFSNVL